VAKLALDLVVDCRSATVHGPTWWAWRQAGSLAGAMSRAASSPRGRWREHRRCRTATLASRVRHGCFIALVLICTGAGVRQRGDRVVRVAKRRI